MNQQYNFTGPNSTARSRKQGIKKLVSVVVNVVKEGSPKGTSAGVIAQMSAALFREALRNERLREDLLIR
jgi:hypothetical protein